MNILCIGDIVGKPGRQAIEKLLGPLKEEFQIDCAVVNAENAAGGSGVTSRMSRFFFRMGCDVLTLGDHVWDQKELQEYLDKEPRIVRPANFPEGQGIPGKGLQFYTTEKGVKIAVINLLGRTFMRYQVDCPFRKFQLLYEEAIKETPIVIVDFHAETTSEKVAFGWFADGLASIVFGTHTHIQTADERVLPRGTAYITDLGMSGPYDSVIGQQKENIILRFMKSMPVKFHVAEKDVRLSGIVVKVDESSGRATAIERIQRCLPEEEDGKN